jgi:hypothetical protein
MALYPAPVREPIIMESGLVNPVWQVWFSRFNENNLNIDAAINSLREAHYLTTEDSSFLTNDTVISDILVDTNSLDLNFDSVLQALSGDVLVRNTTTANTTITVAGVGVDVNDNTSTQKIDVAKNSGATVGTRKQLNFVEGANITLTIADDAINDQVDITIEASGGGASNAGQVLVDFGATETDIVQTTIAAAWVTPASIILCNAAAVDTADHTADEVAVEKIQAYSTNLVNGVSFDIIASSASDSGTTWGKYYINYSGA